MPLSLRNALGIGVLVAAVAGSWYWGRIRVVPEETAGGASAGPLGYYLRDARIAIMGEDGGLLYEISAGAVEERPAENRTVLSGVSVRYSPAAEVPWEARAQTGEIPGDERYIELSGAVRLESTGETGREPTIIRAPRLRIAPDDYRATTDTDVSVELGAERLDAVGMSVDLKGDYLELESTVHGLFNP